MFFKFIFLVLFLLSSVFSGESVLVEKIVAVVNDQIITLSDVHISIQLFPVFQKKEENDREFQKRMLEHLINHKIVYLEYEEEFTLSDEDYEEIQTTILSKIGSLEKLVNLLKTYDMEWKNFKDFIKEKIIYEKVLEEKLQLKILINFSEIEQFYNQDYLPQQNRLKIPPRSLIEMAPLIEKHLRKKKTEKNLSEWLNELKSTYKVENILKKENTSLSKQKNKGIK